MLAQALDRSGWRPALAAAGLLALGCSSPAEEEPLAAREGPTRYFGVATVSGQTEAEGVVTYTFAPSSGPMCMKGHPYRMSVRDQGSEGLFIFLQGGGACWSEFCLAITKAAEGIPKLDILDPEQPSNPLASWSTVYLPYCDGSLFAGDATHDDDGDGQVDRYHRGLQNLSAALDIASRDFPNPSRVVLAGSSGGGYGTILATLLVRAKYPGAPLLVFDDAGVGLGRPGDPGFVDRIVDEFNVRSLITDACPSCLDDGHVTSLVDWELDNDPDLRIAVFSGEQDYVMTDVFLGVDPAVFEAELLEVTGRIHERHPERYQRFFVAGGVHTTLLGGVDGIIGDDLTSVMLPEGILEKMKNIEIGGIDTSTLGGVTVAEWFRAMLDGSPGWDDRVE